LFSTSCYDIHEIHDLMELHPDDINNRFDPGKKIDRLSEY